MFCACIFHGNSMNNLLSYCALIDTKIGASDKDLPVLNHSRNSLKPDDDSSGKIVFPV